MLGDFYGEYYATINGVTYQSTQASWNELDRYGQAFICKEDTAIWYSADQSARDWEFNGGKLSAGGQYYFYGKLDQYAYSWAKSLYLVGMSNREQLPGSGSTLGWTTADCFPNDCTLTLDPGKGSFEGMNEGEKKVLTKPYYYTYHIGNGVEADSRLPILAGHAVRNWVNTERSISFDPEFAYTQTGDLTLNAIWEPSIVTVTFDYQKNSTTVKTVTKRLTVGSEIKLQQYAKDYTENKEFTINYFANKIYLNNNETVVDTTKPVIPTSDYWWPKLPEPQPWSMPYIIAYKIKEFVYDGTVYKSDASITVPNTNITIICRCEDTGTLDLTSIYVTDSKILATSQDVSTTGTLKVTKKPPLLTPETVITEGLTSTQKFNSLGWYKDPDVKLTVDKINELILAGTNSVNAYAKFTFKEVEVLINKPESVKDIKTTYTLGQANFYTPKTINYDDTKEDDSGLAWVLNTSDAITAYINVSLGKLEITKFETSEPQPLESFNDYILVWDENGLLVGKKDNEDYSFTTIVKNLDLKENVTNIELNQEYNYKDGTGVNSVKIPNLASKLPENSGITFVGVIPNGTNSIESELIKDELSFKTWQEGNNYSAYGVFEFTNSEVTKDTTDEKGNTKPNKINKAELKTVLKGIYDRIWYLYSKRLINGNPIINKSITDVTDTCPEVFYLNTNTLLPYGALCRAYFQFNLLTKSSAPEDWNTSDAKYYKKNDNGYELLEYKQREEPSYPAYSPNTYYSKPSTEVLIESLYPNFTENTSALIELEKFRRAAQFFIKFGVDQEASKINFDEDMGLLSFKKGTMISPYFINNFYSRLNYLMGYTTTNTQEQNEVQ